MADELTTELLTIKKERKEKHWKYQNLFKGIFILLWDALIQQVYISFRK